MAQHHTYACLDSPQRGTIINDIFSHEDWMPTLLAAVGETDVKEKLLKGHKAGDKTFKAHLDGYNQLDLLTGKGPGKRNEIFYFDAGSNLNAIRYKEFPATTGDSLSIDAVLDTMKKASSRQ